MNDLKNLTEQEQEKLDGSRAHIQNSHIDIKFQLGPVKEHGINGCQIDDILQILIERVEGFQKGPFSGRENAIVITKLQEAQHWLEHRTRDRERRNVEGTNSI